MDVPPFPACDKSTDISDSAQLLVFLRGVGEHFEVSQELASIETLSGTTKGVDIFLAVNKSSGKEQSEVGESDWHYN